MIEQSKTCGEQCRIMETLKWLGDPAEYAVRADKVTR